MQPGSTSTEDGSEVKIPHRPIDIIVTHRRNVRLMKRLALFADTEQSCTQMTTPETPKVLEIETPIAKRTRQAMKAKNTSSKTIKTSKEEPTQQLQQRHVELMNELVHISFQQMEYSGIDYYYGHLLSCTAIDEMCVGCVTIEILVEDSGGYCGRIVFAGFNNDENLENKFGYGCKIAILNPYFNGDVVYASSGLEVVFLPGRESSRCRYCGISRNTESCPKCHKALYCSEVCMIYDLDVMQHFLICNE